MSLTRTVQFRNVADILEAYRNNDIASFAIVSGQGKHVQLLFPFESDNIEEGAAYLEDILSKIKHSAAIYCIQFYKDVPEEGITSNTPFRNSFNFQLKQLSNQANYQPEYDNGFNNEYMSRLEALTMEVKALREEQQRDSEDEPERKLGMLGEILEHPVLGQIVTAIAGQVGQSIAGMFSNNNNNNNKTPKAMMSGVPETNSIDEQVINAAVAILKGIDPKFGDHLMKLAQVAQADPASYQMFISYLVKM